jgi:hypothetical protein
MLKARRNAIWSWSKRSNNALHDTKHSTQSGVALG